MQLTSVGVDSKVVLTTSVTSQIVLQAVPTVPFALARATCVTLPSLTRVDWRCFGFTAPFALARG